MMTILASSLPRRVPSIAILVMGADGAAMLCPFFAKCDGILLIDPADGSRAFLPNDQRTGEGLCDAILNSGVNQLVCGFIGEPERRKLRAAGIDVRLGSCAWPLDKLATCFHELPRA